MKTAVIATIILVVLFGGAAYLATAGTLIIYALGNNKAAKGKKNIFRDFGRGYVLERNIYSRPDYQNKKWNLISRKRGSDNGKQFS